MVADRLGVDPDELTPDVSLPDELAADSLDLLEIALAAETEFGVVLPERLLEEVRTFGDLVDVVTVCVLRPQSIDGEPAPVWARVLGADGGGHRG